MQNINFILQSPQYPFYVIFSVMVTLNKKRNSWSYLQQQLDSIFTDNVESQAIIAVNVSFNVFCSYLLSYFLFKVHLPVEVVKVLFNYISIKSQNAR